MDEQKRHQCPSVFPDTPQSEIFAVVGGTPEQPEVAYLDRPQPVTEELLKLAEPVDPTEVFRFTAPCAQSGCQHFNSADSQCRLAQRTVKWMPVTVEKLPACSIRKDCVWWNQEGRAACMRCPQVVSHDAVANDAYLKAARPEEDADHEITSEAT